MAATKHASRRTRQISNTPSKAIIMQMNSSTGIELDYTTPLSASLRHGCCYQVTYTSSNLPKHTKIHAHTFSNRKLIIVAALLNTHVISARAWRSVSSQHPVAWKLFCVPIAHKKFVSPVSWLSFMRRLGTCDKKRIEGGTLPASWLNEKSKDSNEGRGMLSESWHSTKGRAPEMRFECKSRTSRLTICATPAQRVPLTQRWSWTPSCLQHEWKSIVACMRTRLPSLMSNVIVVNFEIPDQGMHKIPRWEYKSLAISKPSVMHITTRFHSKPGTGSRFAYFRTNSTEGAKTRSKKSFYKRIIRMQSGIVTSSSIPLDPNTRLWSNKHRAESHTIEAFLPYLAHNLLRNGALKSISSKVGHL